MIMIWWKDSMLCMHHLAYISKINKIKTMHSDDSVFDKGKSHA